MTAEIATVWRVEGDSVLHEGVDGGALGEPSLMILASILMVLTLVAVVLARRRLLS